MKTTRYSMVGALAAAAWLGAGCHSASVDVGQVAQGSYMNLKRDGNDVARTFTCQADSRPLLRVEIPFLDSSHVEVFALNADGHLGRASVDEFGFAEEQFLASSLPPLAPEPHDPEQCHTCLKGAGAAVAFERTREAEGGHEPPSGD